MIFKYINKKIEKKVNRNYQNRRIDTLTFLDNLENVTIEMDEKSEIPINFSYPQTYIKEDSKTGKFIVIKK